MRIKRTNLRLVQKDQSQSEVGRFCVKSDDNVQEDQSQSEIGRFCVRSDDNVQEDQLSLRLDDSV